MVRVAVQVQQGRPGGGGQLAQDPSSRPSLTLTTHSKITAPAWQASVPRRDPGRYPAGCDVLLGGDGV